MRTGTAIFSACVFAALGASSGASAESYPDKPIRVIVATSPGGTSDIFIRAAGEEFYKRTGQRLVVENRSGGAMNIGAEACANGSNDGYTICILPNESLALNEYLYKELPYNPETAFVPITNPFFNPQVIVASATLKVRSMAELAAASKAAPGKLSYSALSVPMRMFIEEWKKKTGADLIQVPARGGGDVATGVMTGTVPVAIVGVPNWLPYIRNGSAVPLAVNTTERLPLLPDVPTLKELGYADAAQMYFGIVAPAKTPASAVEKLYTEFKAIGDETDFRRLRLIEQGLVPVYNSPTEFQSYLTAERASAKRQFEESGMEKR
jgi:tripartite-type tricarboxylate transporter receptor subunit TctC